MVKEVSPGGQSGTQRGAPQACTCAKQRCRSWCVDKAAAAGAPGAGSGQCGLRAVPSGMGPSRRSTLKCGRWSCTLTTSHRSRACCNTRGGLLARRRLLHRLPGGCSWWCHSPCGVLCRRPIMRTASWSIPPMATSARATGGPTSQYGDVVEWVNSWRVWGARRRPRQGRRRACALLGLTSSGGFREPSSRSWLETGELVRDRAISHLPPARRSKGSSRAACRGQAT